MLKRFGETAAETQAISAAKCRNIVAEITNFGVSQDEILAVIHLLALELEDREQMNSIVTLAKGFRTGRIAQLDTSNDPEEGQ